MYYRFRIISLSIISLFAVSSYSGSAEPIWPAGLRPAIASGVASSSASAVSAQSAASASAKPFSGESAPRAAQISRDNPKPPLPTRNSTVKPDAAPSSLDQTKAELSLNFDQVPLPTFIQVLYGSVLRKPIVIDANLQKRTDLVSVRTGAPQTAAQIDKIARSLLKSYGIAIFESGGFYRAVADDEKQGYVAEISRSSSNPETPPSLRPVWHFVELESVKTSDVASTLKQVFNNRIEIREDSAKNALLISTQSGEMGAVLETLQILDQPLMRGRKSIRINPSYWSVDELVKRLSDILTAEGFAISNSPSGGAPIVMLPIGPINSIVVFATSDKVLQHVADWSIKLDQPTANAGGGYFSYPVRHTDAELLAKTLQELMNGAPVAATSGGAAPRASRVVVNKPTNTLIIQGSAEEFTRWMGLLKELDRPSKMVLIEATIAEVTLGDNLNLGIEWAFDNNNVVGGTLGGLGIGSAGLLLKYIKPGQVKAVINALANNNRAQIISSPRLMARNGESASINVGKEVPIITSQQSDSNTGVATGGVLQTIQYRQTGVQLKVRPVIHAGGRIDMEVMQEVSSPQQTTTGVSTTPTFATRRLDTRLTARDGRTIVLGGLMDQANEEGDAGIPYLKDIPVIGQAFRTNTSRSTRSELILLLTPYIIESDEDAEQITSALRENIGASLKVPRTGLETLAGIKATPVALSPLIMQPSSVNMLETSVAVMPLMPNETSITSQPMSTLTPDALPQAQIITDPELLEAIAQSKQPR
ncbi:secretin N-terminal domain-containing protein [Deefgea sp. CFH1-16]|uniref:secretin N-terminal domain-containing protein n=1 Tax=Deefgea sp. CFH1-16 TaxID=2675457 RepID=UPI0015F3850A|nr:secretin N-terminal domain-containing protein [Deefgea sp. CFH1-16]MBM5573534.1 hypothetical protein [Deefgea sp. CFH1-16]